MWKLEYIEGGQEYVLKELHQKHLSNTVIRVESKYIYIEGRDLYKKDLLSLTTITKLYYSVQDPQYSPKYLSRHKSIISKVLSHIGGLSDFESFMVQCAGKDTEELQSIIRYISQEISLPYLKEDADLKIQVVKVDGVWEVNCQLTSRPLSVRSYRSVNFPGALNPTVAAGMCILADVSMYQSIFNPFCGSGTLLIEALKNNSRISRAIGWDIDREAIQAAYENIKSSHLIKDIDIEIRDITIPSTTYEKFDVILADLPFGMLVSKHMDLETLYRAYISLVEKVLNIRGVMVVITSQATLFEGLIQQSQLYIDAKVALRQATSVNSYLNTTIFVCKFQNEDKDI